MSTTPPLSWNNKKNPTVVTETVIQDAVVTTHHNHHRMENRRTHTQRTMDTYPNEDEEEERYKDELHDRSRHRVRRPGRGGSILSPILLATSIQQQHLLRQDDLSRRRRRDKEEEEQRRSRRETTIHSTKASIQLEKQNNGTRMSTKKDDDDEEEEVPVRKTTVAKDANHKVNRTPLSQRKKIKNQKPAATIDSTTINPNTSKKCPPIVSRRSSPTTTMTTHPTGSPPIVQPPPPLPQNNNEELPRRCSVRNRSTAQSLYELASMICGGIHHPNDTTTAASTHSQQHPPNVLFITGAGLSVDSGIRPFRTSIESSTASGYYGRDPNFNNIQRTKSNHILQAGVWDEVIWTMATRASFRKDPVRWYTHFWNVYFNDKKKYKPNIGHYVMDSLLNEFTNVYQITQNIDGLQAVASTATTIPITTSDSSLTPKKQLIEVHGRCGLYKCCPPEEDDTDDDDSVEQVGDSNIDASFDYPGDEPDRGTTGSSNSTGGSHRPVRIGSHKASRKLRNRTKHANSCPYEYLYSLTSEQVIFRNVTVAPSQQQQQSKFKSNTSQKWDVKYSRSNYNIDDNHHSLITPTHNTRSNRKRKSTSTMATTPVNDDLEQNVVSVPTCPHCHNIVMPQALLFDESYHDHTYYQYELVEEWIKNASAIVLVGTSCTVQLTTLTLKYALRNSIPVYNMNTHKIAVPQTSFSDATADCTESGTTIRSTNKSNTTTTETTSNSVPTGSILNILGPASETLPLLLAECRSIQEAKQQKRGA